MESRRLLGSDDTYVQRLQTEQYAAKTIETRMGVIFSMLKDNKKETGVEYAAQLVSLPEPLHTRPKAYAEDEIPKLFGNQTLIVSDSALHSQISWKHSELQRYR